MTTPGLVIPVDLAISVSGLPAIQAEVKAKIAAINAEISQAQQAGQPYSLPAIGVAYQQLTSEAQRAVTASGVPVGAADPLFRKIGVAGASAYVGAGGALNPTSVGGQLLEEDKAQRTAVREHIAALEKDTLAIQTRSDVDEEEGAAFIQAKALNIEAQHEATAVLQEEIAARGIQAQSDAAASTARAKIAAEAKAISQQQLEADEAYIANTLAASEARAQSAARVQLRRSANELPASEALLAEEYRRAASELEGQSLIQRAATAKKVTSQLKSAQVVESMTDAELSLSLQARAAQAQATQAQRRQTIALLRTQALSGDLGGTFYQRLQSRFSATGKLPTENPTFGQAIGQKTLTTLGYGIAGGAVFGAAFGIAKIIKDAELLEQTLKRLDAQLTAAGQGDRFAEVRASVISISEETGAVTNDVAIAVTRMVGAFHDVDLGTQSAEESMKLMVLTGNDLDTTLQDGIATSKAFGVSVAQMGDVVVDVAERTGVSAGSLEKFLGETAAVAAEAGLSLRDTAIIGAHAAQQLGRAPDQEAATFDRVLSQVVEFKEQILAIYATSPALAKNLNTIAGAFAEGRQGDVLKQLIADFNSLTKAQQESVIAQVGGKKGAPFLTGLLQDSQSLTEELTSTDTSAGKLNDRFATIQDTLKNVGQRLHAVFRELGDALLNAGVGDIFEGIAVAIAGVVRGVTLLLQGFHSLDDATKGISNFLGNLLTFGKLGDIFPGFLSTFAEIAIVAAVVTKAINFAREAFQGFGQAGADKAQALAKNETAAASIRKAEALALESEATGVNTGVIGTNVVAEEKQTAAKVAGAGASAQAATGAATQAAATEALALEQGIAFAIPGSLGQRFKGATLGSGLGAKLFSGGTLLKSGTADAAAGGAAGASGAGIAGLVAAGVIAVGQSYFSNRGDRENQAKDLAAQLRGKDAARLKQVKEQYEANESLYDRFSVAIFGVKGPADLLQDEINRSQARGGIQIISAAQAKGELDKVVQGLSDQNLKRVQDILNASDETKKAFQEAGGELSESTVDRIKNVSALIPGVQDSKGVVSDLSRQQLEAVLPKLKEAADRGDEGAARAIGEIEGILRGEAGLSVLVTELATQGKASEAIQAAGGIDQYLGLTTSQAKSQLEAGKISFQTYIDQAKQRLEEARLANDHTPASQEALDKAEADFQKVTNDRVKQLATEAAQLDVARGTDQLDAEIGALQARINSPETSGTEKLSILPDLIAKENDRFKKNLELIGDPNEILRIAQTGITTSPELQRLLVAQQTEADATTARDTSDIANAIGEHFDNLNFEIASEVADTDKTVREVQTEVIDKKLAELQQLLLEASNDDQRGKIQAQIDQLNSIRGRINAPSVQGDPADFKPDEFKDRKLTPDQQHEAVEVARTQLRAIGDVVKASVESNPLASAQAALAELQQELQLVQNDPKAKPEAVQQLQAQIIRAQRQVEDTTHDILRANLELMLGVARNPVAAGRNQLLLAQFDQATAAAKGDTAAAARAGLQVQSAQFAIADAQSDIARARLEAAGGASRDPAEQARQALILAQFDQAAAEAKGDTAAALRASIQVQSAQKQVQDADAERVKAMLDLEEAQTLDPVEQARIAQRRADQAAANAHSVAESIQAQAQRVTADRQMQDALAAIADSQSNLLIAVAEAAGDTVGAANLQLEEARRKLQEAIAKGAGQAAINNAQIEVVKSQAAVRDAQFNKSLGDIEFAASVQEITTAQEIQMLEALAAVPGHTEEQMRAIRQKIFELKQEVGRDFQFNIPQLDISGLFYQANRVLATRAAGQGYQTNHTTNAIININGADNPAAWAATIAKVINGPAGGAQNTPGVRLYK